MPIYAYRCETCGHAKDVLQKISDEPLQLCPACGASTFRKQLTAAGFQLKGSGWYVTDFRDKGGAKPSAGDAGDKAGEKPADKAADQPAAGAAPAPAPAAEKSSSAPSPAPAASSPPPSSSS